MTAIRRRLVAAAFLGSGALAFVTAGASAKQAATTAEQVALADAVRGRFEVATLVDGLALTPRDPAVAARMIQVGDGIVAVDGVSVTGRELRDLLGEDAGLVLRLTYLDEPAWRALFADAAAPPAPAAAAAEDVQAADAAPADVDAAAPGAADPGTAAAAAADAAGSAGADASVTAPEDTGAAPAAGAAGERDPRPARDAEERPSRRTSRDDVLRIGSSVTIDNDERVRGDVAVIGGSLRVDGEVTGNIVVIGGAARFGPEAEVRGEVTIVGGSLNRAPTAELRGGVTHVAVGPFTRAVGVGNWFPNSWPFGRRVGLLSGGWDLAGTAMRLFFLALLASLAFFLARGPVERVARRARAEPVKAGLVGFLAQFLFVPLMVVTVVLLAISLVGIPLLLLIPFVLVAILVLLVFGFSGVVLGLGDLIRSRMGSTGTATYASVWAGIALLLVPTLAGEAMELFGGVFAALGVLMALTGLFVEYAAWTAGLGALLLNRFGGPLPAPSGAPGPVPPVEPTPGPPPAPPADSTDRGAPPAPPIVPEPPSMSGPVPDVGGRAADESRPVPDVEGPVVEEPPPDAAGRPQDAAGPSPDAAGRAADEPRPRDRSTD